VIPEVKVTSCSYSRPQRKIILGLSDGKSVSISHHIVATYCVVSLIALLLAVLLHVF